VISIAKKETIMRQSWIAYASDNF